MAKIYVHKKKGVAIGFVADLGKDRNGKRIKHFFKKESDAQICISKHQKDPIPVGVLLEKRNEFLHCYDQLQAVGASLTEATQFFLKHGAVKPNVTLEKLLEEFIAAKRRIERRQVYLDSIDFMFRKFMESVGKTTLIKDVTSDQIGDYVYQKNKDLGKVTKIGILSNLSILFNFAKNKRYISFNPTKDIERPKKPDQKPSVLSPEDFKKVLDKCFKKKWYDRITVFILVGYCGVRIEEASKICWRDIDLVRGMVTVSHEIAKKHRYRNIPIPPNALKWFKAIHDGRRTDAVIGENWKNLIRSSIRFCHIDYSKNCIRHSYCSYSLAHGESITNLVNWMGHSGNPSMIHEHYKNLVVKEEAEKWFSIVPYGNIITNNEFFVNEE